MKTATGYASTPTVLVDFGGAYGANPLAGLMIDATGNLFGTASAGGSSAGTLFEVVNTAAGYATAPTVLSYFDGTHGYYPRKQPDR